MFHGGVETAQSRWVETRLLKKAAYNESYHEYKDTTFMLPCFKDDFLFCGQIRIIDVSYDPDYC